MKSAFATVLPFLLLVGLMSCSEARNSNRPSPPEDGSSSQEEQCFRSLKAPLQDFEGSFNDFKQKINLADQGIERSSNLALSRKLVNTWTSRMQQNSANFPNLLYDYVQQTYSQSSEAPGGLGRLLAAFRTGDCKSLNTYLKDKITYALADLKMLHLNLSNAVKSGKSSNVEINEDTVYSIQQYLNNKYNEVEEEGGNFLPLIPTQDGTSIKSDLRGKFEPNTLLGIVMTTQHRITDLEPLILPRNTVPDSSIRNDDSQQISQLIDEVNELRSLMFALLLLFVGGGVAVGSEHYKVAQMVRDRARNRNPAETTTGNETHDLFTSNSNAENHPTSSEIWSAILSLQEKLDSLIKEVNQLNTTWIVDKNPQTSKQHDEDPSSLEQLVRSLVAQVKSLRQEIRIIPKRNILLKEPEQEESQQETKKNPRISKFPGDASESVLDLSIYSEVVSSYHNDPDNVKKSSKIVNPTAISVEQNRSNSAFPLILEEYDSGIFWLLQYEECLLFPKHGLKIDSSRKSAVEAFFDIEGYSPISKHYNVSTPATVVKSVEMDLDYWELKDRGKINFVADT